MSKGMEYAMDIAESCGIEIEIREIRKCQK